MRAIILDTETTGLDEPEVIELTWIDAADLCGDRGWHRFQPSKPISLGALAAHHIMDEDLVALRPSHEAGLALPQVDYIIGHNVDYDWLALGSPNVRRICTLAMARRLWPDADTHTLGAMMYLHYRDRARGLLRHAHSTAIDVECCALLLRAIMETANIAACEDRWAALWDFSEEARVPTHMAVGKHKGMLISDLPRDYKEWFLRQPDVDPYLRLALLQR